MMKGSDSNLPEYSVSEVAHAIKVTLEETFSYIRIRGEISGLKVASSGHIYFSLKDNNAVLNAVCWKNTANQLPFQIEDGVEVICTGSISSFPGRSYYQLIVEKVEVAGIGALLAMLEKRKQKLEAEGLFEVSRKKSIPYLPRTIGVITSPTGAVIRDILHRISERFPVHILLWGVLVQGSEAAEQIAGAITGFNNLPSSIPKPDILIVARGGGSIEDLWAFNEEIVIRATADSKIPIISAVGHETDTTLIDFASDKRAPTPTAAAEIAVPVLSDLKYTLETLKRRLDSTLPNLIKHNELKLNNLSTALGFFLSKIISLEGKLENIEFKLSNLMTNLLQRLNSKLQIYGMLLDSFHYQKVLKRGFALIRDNKGKVIKSITQIKLNSVIKIELHDGTQEALALNVSGKSRITKNSSKEDQQQSLFDNS
ncbi:exodeoxyribonuclease VII large subunit [Holosporaceae bacterium 'Namur']|nr:exodeoxyribonuclease VII large subunit [Holosporaceae bacterium 'Namur']